MSDLPQPTVLAWDGDLMPLEAGREVVVLTTAEIETLPWMGVQCGAHPTAQRYIYLSKTRWRGEAGDRYGVLLAEAIPGGWEGTGHPGGKRPSDSRWADPGPAIGYRTVATVDSFKFWAFAHWLQP